MTHHLIVLTLAAGVITDVNLEDAFEALGQPQNLEI